MPPPRRRSIEVVPGPTGARCREWAGTDPLTRQTLYLLASAVASGSSAPLVAAFVEDVTETARHLAARSPGARLDPPLLLALDEIANLTPLPSLPSLMAEGGGTGITTLAVLQSLAQARGRWGEHAADAIWDAATVKLVLGGLAKYRDLDYFARLLGEIDEVTHTTNRSRRGDASTSTSMRAMPVMPPAVLRTLKSCGSKSGALPGRGLPSDELLPSSTPRQSRCVKSCVSPRPLCRT